MNRRNFLRYAGATVAVASAGCISVFGESKPEPATVSVVAVDILNRRSKSHIFHFVAEYNGKPIHALSQRIKGTDNSSLPTGFEISGWPKEPGAYRFSFRLDKNENWFYVTPRELGGLPEMADCYRPMFVINLGDRVTALHSPKCSNNNKI